MTEMERLVEVEQRSKSNSHQIDEIKDDIKEIKSENKAIYELTTSVRLIAQDMGTIKDAVKKVEAGQEALAQKQDGLAQEILDVKNKPAQETAASWSKIKVAVATSLATALVMGVFGAIVMFVK